MDKYKIQDKKNTMTNMEINIGITDYRLSYLLRKNENTASRKVSIFPSFCNIPKNALSYISYFVAMYKISIVKNNTKTVISKQTTTAKNI